MSTSTDFDNPAAPVLLDRAFEDPERIRALVRQNGPYWPTMRYIANASELSAVGSSSRKFSVAPWFRADWAYGKSLVEGGDEVLANPLFIEAARAVFGAEVVRPEIVYVNVMGPMGVGPAHIDVPAFRGIDRTEYPVSFLHLMHRSGLFEEHRISIATAVAWFYEGENGIFEYWPDGVNGAAKQIDAPLSNRAVVGDNDVMFHRVGPIGGSNRPEIDGATLDVELVPDPVGDGWKAIDQGVELLSYADVDIRVSVSWKAEVFADAEAERVRVEHLDDLALDSVVDRMLDDLARLGNDVERPEDPLRDESFIQTLNAAYPMPAPQGK